MARVLIAGNKLGAAISSFAKGYAGIIEDAHILAVSTLAYTSKSGRTDMLNDFYAVLSEAHKGAFRQYLGRVMGMDKAEQWLDFAKSQFTLVADRAKQREAFDKAVPLWVAGGEGYEPFHNKISLNRAAEPFGDADVFEALKRLAKRVSKDDAKVSPEVKAMVNTLLAEANATAIKLDKRAKDKAKVNAEIAKNAPRPARIVAAKPIVAPQPVAV